MVKPTCLSLHVNHPREMIGIPFKKKATHEHCNKEKKQFYFIPFNLSLSRQMYHKTKRGINQSVNKKHLSSFCTPVEHFTIRLQKTQEG